MIAACGQLLSLRLHFRIAQERTDSADAYMRIDGACHCGEITFSAEIDPAGAMICHCTDCQVMSGAAFRVVVLAPLETFVVHGEPKSYVKVADSGSRRAQQFCATCGTPLYAMAAEHPTSVSIRVGCVRQRSELVPRAQIWQRSAMSWLQDLHRIPGSPEQQALSLPRGSVL
jgi:hypothetical protein